MTSPIQKIFMVAALASFATIPPAVHAAGKKSKTAKTSKAEAPPAPPPDAKTPDAPTTDAPSTGAATSGTVMDTITGSADHSTLASAIKAAGLDGALAGPGPFTIFAPSNAAFDRLPPGTVDGLLKPESRGQLSAILASHVVAGSLTAADLASQIQAGGGTATLTTATGAQLKASMDGSAVVISDSNGGTAKVTTADMKQGNGMVHSIDGVLQPKVATPQAAPSASPAPESGPAPTPPPADTPPPVEEPKPAPEPRK